MNIASKIIGGENVSAAEIIRVSRETPLSEMGEAAAAVRTHFLGKDFDTCSIMNARSGKCSEDCKWCAQSAHYDTGCKVYGYVSAADVLVHAKYFKDRGVRRFSLVTSGRTVSDDDLQKLCDAFSSAKKEGGIELCGSFGLLTRPQFERLKASGMSRFHCNLETAPSYFPKLCTTHTIADKISSIEAARSVGMSICSGGIIGMGETFEQRVELADTLGKLRVDSIPMNILQPIKGTPLENTSPLSREEILLSFAVFRLLNPKAHIRFAGGRLAIKDFQDEALSFGVSAMLMGDMLTTVGSKIDDDFKMLKRLGYEY